MTTLTFAVLVDGENASQSQYVAMLEEIERYGAVAIKWVYADWTSSYQSGWRDVLYETASSPKQQFHYGKDAADHALVMDAIELIGGNPRINAFCIVSSDGGFYSLAQRIREYGLHVMAIGREDTPERFRKACHNFVFTKNLSDASKVLSHSDLDTLLIDSYRRLAEKNEPVYLGDMGKMLRMVAPSFEARSYGFVTLKKLINDKNNLFDIVDEQIDRCFIVLKVQYMSESAICLQGTVRKWDSSRKFGFIKSAEGDFHFNATEIRGDAELICIGDPVKFDVTSSDDFVRSQDGKCPSVCNVIINREVA